MAAVTLDLWHTLVYLDPEAEERYMERQVAVARQVLAAAPRRVAVAGPTSEDEARAFEQALSNAVAQSELGHTVSPADQLRSAGETIGRSPDTTVYLELLTRLVQETPFKVAPGALEFLRGLRDDGYRLAIISNTVGEPGQALRPVLDRLGVGRFVESMVFSDEQPWTKPSPEIFRKALGTLAEPPERSVHVGDGWVDVEGARRAGYRASVLFTGLPAYGARYRALFGSTARATEVTPYRSDRLDDVGKIVRELLPLSGP